MTVFFVIEFAMPVPTISDALRLMLESQKGPKFMALRAFQKQTTN